MYWLSLLKCSCIFLKGGLKRLKTGYRRDFKGQPFNRRCRMFSGFHFLLTYQVPRVDIYFVKSEKIHSLEVVDRGENSN